MSVHRFSFGLLNDYQLKSDETTKIITIASSIPLCNYYSLLFSYLIQSAY